MTRFGAEFCVYKKHSVECLSSSCKKETYKVDSCPLDHWRKDLRWFQDISVMDASVYQRFKRSYQECMRRTVYNTSGL